MIFGIPAFYFYWVIILLTIGVLVFIFLNYNKAKVNRREDPFNAQQFAPVIKALDEGMQPDNELVNALAADVTTRYHLFHILKSYHQTGFFPEKYYSLEYATEASLANWLIHYSSKLKLPKEIKYLEDIWLEDDEEYYRVYQFQLIQDEDENANYLGVVGPLKQHSKPYEETRGTNSRFSASDQITPKEEVIWANDELLPPEY